MKNFIGSKLIGNDSPTYFIADVASNHEGDLIKAKELVYACKEAKASAVKMQNFTADTIVSDYGFKNLTGINTHQNKWKKSVYESYSEATIPLEWTLEIKELCKKIDIDYFTSPYSIDLVEKTAEHLCAFKIGSGDITWLEIIEKISSYDKPIILATGASSMEDVIRAVNVLEENNANYYVLQCNTNYSATKNESYDNLMRRYKCLNLSVIKSYKDLFGVECGLSDHTHGDLSVSVATLLFGANIIEKHFTLDNTKDGQDHSFSMMPKEWLKMVDLNWELKTISKNLDHNQKINLLIENGYNIDEINACVGNGVKKVEDNEISTQVVQRRSIRLNKNLQSGDYITKEDIEFLRPCPNKSIQPFQYKDILGKKLCVSKVKGSELYIEDFDV